MRYLIGIDDTDNLESRGTGHRARQLGELLGRSGMALLGVTRHQLLLDPAIPYTSHNSAACIEVRGTGRVAETAIAVCREFLRADSAAGSDAGLCVADASSVTQPIVDFGTRAKTAIVRVAEAETLAGQTTIHLEPITGTGLGVIGALAAVGLRVSADDGRFLWLPGLRELSGIHHALQLRQQLGLDTVETEDGRQADDHDRVRVGEWPRPLLRGGRKVFLVEETRHENCRWSSLGKDRLKRLSD